MNINLHDIVNCQHNIKRVKLLLEVSIILIKKSSGNTLEPCKQYHYNDESIFLLDRGPPQG